MTQQQFERILYQALRPEVAADATAIDDRHRRKRKGTCMNIKKFVKKAGMVAAALVLLGATTVCASGGAVVKRLVSRTESYRYSSFQDMDQAMKKAGFQMAVQERLPGGYVFSEAAVRSTEARDADDRRLFCYYKIDVEYRDASGKTLDLIAHERREGIVDTEHAPGQSRMVGAVTASYFVDHYKLVPAGYEWTQEDEKLARQPGYFISEGSGLNAVQESEVALMTWEQDGICYTLMDMGAQETANQLFAIAGKLVLGG